MSIITYTDVKLFTQQLLLNYRIIDDNTFCFIVCENGKSNDLIYAVTEKHLILHNDVYLNYCDKNNNNIIETFIKNKKIKLQLYPNIYKSNIQNIDLISTLYIQHCKYLTNIVNSKKIERLFVDSLKK